MFEMFEFLEVSNYYGVLVVKEEGGKFFWSVENWDGHHWNEIPEYLFVALKKFHEER